MKKNKKLFCFLILILFIIPLQAQESIHASGGNASGNDGNSSYSVGQVTYTVVESSSGIENLGIQLPFEIVALGNDAYPDITLQMFVYPNPVDSFIVLKIDNYKTQPMHYILSDINGRELSSQTISESESQIDMNYLPSAIYFLQVMDADKILKSFKILKK